MLEGLVDLEKLLVQTSLALFVFVVVRQVILTETACLMCEMLLTNEII